MPAIQIDQRQIGPVTLTNEPTVFQPEEPGGCMGGFFGDEGQVKGAIVMMFQQTDESLLDQRQARRRLEIRVLFSARVWGA